MKCPGRRRVGRRKISCFCRESNRGSLIVQSDARRPVTVPTIRRLVCSERDASSCSIKGEAFLDQSVCQIVNKIIELRHSDVAMATAAACFVQNGHKSTVITGHNGREKYVFALESSLTVTKFCTFIHEIPGFLAPRNVAVVQRTLTVFAIYMCMCVCVCVFARRR
jgi:hypothetical protein